jgi:hypothetical protein
LELVAAVKQMAHAIKVIRPDMLYIERVFLLPVYYLIKGHQAPSTPFGRFSQSGNLFLNKRLYEFLTEITL